MIDKSETDNFTMNGGLSDLEIISQELSLDTDSISENSSEAIHIQRQSGENINSEIQKNLKLGNFILRNSTSNQRSNYGIKIPQPKIQKPSAIDMPKMQYDRLLLVKQRPKSTAKSI